MTTTTHQTCKRHGKLIDPQTNDNLPPREGYCSQCRIGHETTHQTQTLRHVQPDHYEIYDPSTGMTRTLSSTQVAHACNAHTALLEALKEAYEVLQQIEPGYEHVEVKVRDVIAAAESEGVK